jgi:hypothetical protein
MRSLEEIAGKRKAQARKLAPNFISTYRITNPEGKSAMVSGFILCVESAT